MDRERAVNVVCIISKVNTFCYQQANDGRLWSAIWIMSIAMSPYDIKEGRHVDESISK